MHITDIIIGLWVIIPKKLLKLLAIYATYAHGNKIDIAAVEARDAWMNSLDQPPWLLWQ